MKDLILIPLMLAVFVYGYFLMERLDKFLDEERKAIKRKEEIKDPSFVMLNPKLSQLELEKEIDRFKNKHSDTRIFLYDGSEIEFPFCGENDSV